MARMNTSDLDKYAFDFGELASIPDSVVADMLAAEGEIIRDGQSKEAANMLQGPYYKGGVSASPKVGAVKKTRDGKAVYVTFSGSQHGNALSEIAFVNELGKHGQPPRQFIRVANEKHADKAVDAAAKVYDTYLKSKGF